LLFLGHDLPNTISRWPIKTSKDAVVQQTVLLNLTNLMNNRKSHVKYFLAVLL